MSALLAVLSEMITLLTGGITEIASGIGGGLQALVTAIFLSGSGTSSDPYTLSLYGGVIIIFAGVSLAIGLSKLVVNWITNLGN